MENGRLGRANAGTGSAAILAAVSGILPETLREHGLVDEIGVFSRRGFGKMPNPAAKMAALPEQKNGRIIIAEIHAPKVIRFPCGTECLVTVPSLPGTLRHCLAFPEDG